MTACVAPNRTTARVAARALVRTTCLALPGTGDDEYATAADECAAAYALAAALAQAAQDELYEAAGRGGDERLRTEILLPLRRAIHNDRPPGERLERAGRALELPAVDGWLAAMGRAAAAAARLCAAEPAALAAARRDLARLCADEGFQRGVALTSPTLLHAVRRAAERDGEVDRRAAKSEATVLRHVLRAATRTSPLTWFAHVGWAEPGSASAAGSPRALVRLDLGALATLIERAVAALPLDATPLRLAEEHHVHAGRHAFLRADPDGRRQLVELPGSPTVDAICALVAAAAPGTATPTHLTAQLPGTAGLIARLRELGLLRPDDVLDEQSPTLVADAACWLRAAGRGELADGLTALDDAAAGWPDLPAARRGAALADLERRWTELLGEPAAAVLTEDVVVTAPSAIELPDLATLEPLLACFDWFAVVRRAAVARFVTAYGRGGRCPSVAEYGALYDGIWRDPDPGANLADATLEDLLALRARLAGLVQRGTDDVLPEAALTIAAEQLPLGLRTRPVSYSVFAMPAGGQWVLNEVYGGWGRFTSRFLAGLSPDAAARVRADLHASLPGGRIAQARPTQHYAANLHPLLVADEIADRAGRGTLELADLEVVHDEPADELRFRVRASGELLDVLYLGFLVPMALPRPMAALVNDLGSGLVDLRPLRTGRRRATCFGTVGELPRLRCGEFVLGRRTWLLGAAQVEAITARLTTVDPAITVARLRAELDLPARVFLGAGPAGAGALPGVSAFVTRMGRARAQYVDLANPLHVRHLARTLARYPDGLRIEEALPAPEPSRPARELVFETYRRAAAGKDA